MSDPKYPAIEGGNPVADKKIPYGRQSLNENDIQAVTQSLRSGWITRGPRVQEFEESVAEMVGSRYAVAFSSATAGLHACSAMLGGDKKKIGLSPMTFCSTANSILFSSKKPRFFDVERDSLNIDPAKIDPSAIDALICIDFTGRPCDYDSVREVCDRAKLSLIIDAAHSLGAKYKGKPIGTQARASVFSFHPVKSITTGEGGMVVCDNEEDAQFLRQFRNHGNTKEITAGYYEMQFLGYNYHLTDFQAALGLSQLNRLSEFLQKRRSIAAVYTQKLKDLPMELPCVPQEFESSWHLYPIRLRLEELQIDRDRFLEALRAEGIGAQVHYIPVNAHPYYQQNGYEPEQTPIAWNEYKRLLSIPIFPDLKESEQSKVIQALEKLCAYYQK